MAGWQAKNLSIFKTWRIYIYIIYYRYMYYRLIQNGAKRDKKVSDDVRDRIRAPSSIGGVRKVFLGCGGVLGTHEPTRFNHNGPLYDFKNTSKYRIKSIQCPFAC